MEKMIDKFYTWAQLVGSILFALFSAFNFVRSLACGQSVVYIISFAAMLLLSIKLERISLAELRKLNKTK